MLNEHCSSNDDLMIIARISTKPFPSLSHQLFSPHPSLTYSPVSTQGRTSRRMRCCDQINFSLQKDQIIPTSPILDRCFFISSVTMVIPLTSFQLLPSFDQFFSCKELLSVSFNFGGNSRLQNSQYKSFSSIDRPFAV